MTASASSASRSSEQSHYRPVGPKGRIFVRALGRFRPHVGQLAVLVVLIAATATADLLPALIIKEMVDEAVPGVGSTGRIVALLAFLVGVVISSALLSVAREYVKQATGHSVMHRLRTDLQQHLQRLPVRFFTDSRTGEVLSRVSTDVNALYGAVTVTFAQILQNGITLAVAFGLMLALDWRLALALTAVLPLLVFPTIVMGQVQRRLMRQRAEESAEMTAQLEETMSVSGIMLVKTFGRQEHEAERFERSSARLRSLSIRSGMLLAWFSFGTALVTTLSFGAVYGLGAIGVVNGEGSIGTVVAFALITQRVFNPFGAIVRSNIDILASLAIYERVFEFLDLPVEVDERPDAIRLADSRGAIRFEDVTFSYAPDLAPALEHISLEVRPGQMAALVGPSGAGKTTATYLLQRFYDPQEGCVTLDGHDLRDVSLDSLAGTIGSVMQETHLFHTTLGENIRYGRLDASEQEVRAAATLAGLGDLVERLPEGLKTVVGQRGFRLSGGEKQRVSIARAVLKDAPVLILDEATSSLDSRLEREIQAATSQLASGRTTIVIAHRLATVIAADVIFVFDGGRIVERGRHDELLAQGGLYASLYHAQFRAETAGATAAAVS